jgi:hypothetical protein
LSEVGRILVDMHNPTTTSSRTPRPVRRTVTQAIPVPQTRAESHELRELLESNLHAMQALLEEHQRTIERCIRTVDALGTEVRTELRALADNRAPWVQAVAETRALLYVALREIIVGNNEAGVSLHMAAQPKEGEGRVAEGEGRARG